MVDSSNEKKEVEEYLKLYAMEELLDEILNEVIIERPTNPYVAMALLCESKTLPEIIDITFRSAIVGGDVAVQANLTTNIATFTGIASYGRREADAPNVFRDYAVLRDKVREAILEVDPVNLSKLDENVSKLGIEPAESLALSIACCRAGARHKGKKLYHYIASLAGLKPEEVRLPVPTVSVLSRFLDGTATTQDLTLTAVKASTFPSAMELLLQAATVVAQSEGIATPRVYSAWGSPCVTSQNIVTAARLVHSVVSANDLAGDVKQGLHVRADYLLKQPIDPVEPSYRYFLENPSSAPPPPEAPPKKGQPVEVPQIQPKAGSDVTEALVSLWQEVEFVTLSEPVYAHDQNSVKVLHKRLQETAYDLKAANAPSMQYSLAGVGGDPHCSLQVYLDALSFAEVPDVDQLAQESPYNTVSLQLSRFASVSQALDVIRKARTVKWPVALVSNDTAEAGPESTDTFLADFAVGAGVGQFLMGGVFTAECSSKYNRMLEIADESPTIRYAGARFRLK